MYNAEHLNADALCARGFEMEYKNKIQMLGQTTLEERRAFFLSFVECYRTIRQLNKRDPSMIILIIYNLRKNHSFTMSIYLPSELMCLNIHKDWNALLKEISELEYSSKFKTTLKDYIKVRLHTAINQADFISWCMLYTNEGNKMHP